MNNKKPNTKSKIPKWIKNKKKFVLFSLGGGILIGGGIGVTVTMLQTPPEIWPKDAMPRDYFKLENNGELKGFAAALNSDNVKDFDTLMIPMDTVKISAHAFDFEVHPEYKEIMKNVKTVVFPINSTHDIDIGEGAFAHSTINVLRVNKLRSIGKKAFFGCKDLKKVYFDAEIERIEAEAFAESGLEGDLILPSTLKDVGIGAFKNCKKLNGIINLGTGIHQYNMIKENNEIAENRLADSMFEGCVNITGISFPSMNNNWIIGKKCFSGCTKLMELNLATAQKLQEIDESAFEGNLSLVAVNFDNLNHIIKIGKKAFKNCTHFATLTVTNASASSKPTINIIDEEAFENCNFTEFDANKFKELNKIEKNAFANNKKLNKVILTSSVTNIGEAAFRNCAITDLRFADNSNISNIGEAAFKNNKITTLVIPKFNKIGKEAFSNNQITSLTLPAEISPTTDSEIGDRAFFENENLTFSAQLNFPNNLQFLGSEVFSENTLYNASTNATVSIPESIKTIGKNTLYINADKHFKDISLVEDKYYVLNGKHIHINLSSLSDFVGNNNILTDDFFNGKSITSGSVIRNCYSIGNNTFSHISNTTNTEIKLGGNVKVIGNNAFDNEYINEITFTTQINKNDLILRDYSFDTHREKGSITFADENKANANDLLEFLRAHGLPKSWTVSS